MSETRRAVVQEVDQVVVLAQVVEKQSKARMSRTARRGWAVSVKMNSPCPGRRGMAVSVTKNLLVTFSSLPTTLMTAHDVGGKCAPPAVMIVLTTATSGLGVSGTGPPHQVLGPVRR